MTVRVGVGDRVGTGVAVEVWVVVALLVGVAVCRRRRFPGSGEWEGFCTARRCHVVQTTPPSSGCSEQGLPKDATQKLFTWPRFVSRPDTPPLGPAGWEQGGGNVCTVRFFFGGGGCLAVFLLFLFLFVCLSVLLCTISLAGEHIVAPVVTKPRAPGD